MRDTGRAAIIIGGYTEINAGGQIAGVFQLAIPELPDSALLNIDAANLYRKQGNDFSLHMILVSGRKAEPFDAAPTIKKYLLSRPKNNFTGRFLLSK